MTAGRNRPSADDSGTLQALRERAGMEYTHTPRTIVTIVAWAAVLGWYLSWLTADFGLRFPAFLLGTTGMAVVLYRQPTRRYVTVVSLYALAGLLVLTPVFMNLYFLLSAGEFGISNTAAFVVGLSDLIFLVAFAVLAAIPAVLARRLTPGSDTEADPTTPASTPE